MSQSGGDPPPSIDTLARCPAVRMVLQRYRHAKILIDENRVVALGNTVSNLLASESDGSSSVTAGILVYVSFSKTATKTKTEQAARTLLNLPILTLGAWGDGLGTNSLLQLSAEIFQERKTSRSSQIASGPALDEVSPLSLLLVPQANLTATVKKLGKSIQYRDQIEKAHGEELYEYFCGIVEKLLIEHHEGVQQDRGLHLEIPPVGPGRGTDNQQKAPTKLDPAIPPQLIFRQDDTYGSFEDEGEQIFPLTFANGQPLTKSALKKLQKIYNAHATRHARYIEARKGNGIEKKVGTTQTVKWSSGAVGEEDMASVSMAPESLQSRPVLDNSFIQLVAGSFGKRQGIEIQSDMGPFCHVVETF